MRQSIPKPVQFPYSTFTDAQGAVLARPLVPIQLKYTRQTLDFEALLDTGADTSVLPYHQGILLGLDWDEATPTGKLSGNLSPIETRAVILDAFVGPFPLERLAFIWIKSDAAHPILGHLNFFHRFNVCFFSFDRTFEILPRIHQPSR